MKESKCKWVRLGDYIEACDERNSDLLISNSQGISNQKHFQTPKQVSVNSKSDKIVRRGWFAYNRATTRNGEKISIAYREGEDCTVSSAYQTFYIKDETKLNPYYLWLYFKRPEFDRYARYKSKGSAHEFFEFDEMCRVEIPLPSLAEQQKVVNAWKALREIKEQNEEIAAPLMQVCQSYIQELKHKYESVEIGPYIEEIDERNSDLSVRLSQGIANSKVFQNPKQVSVNSKSDKIVRHGYFGYNRATTRNGEKISIAYREGEDCTVSSAYGVFRITDESILNPHFLWMWVSRPEFDRYARYMSKGSAHEFFEMDEMRRVRIPLPPLSVQQAIVNIYNCANEAKKIVAEADRMSREVCPALIQHVINNN
nr:restriction endonuclease subunit S [Prevotella sp.]